MTHDLTTHSDAETRAVGRRLSGLLRAGDLVILSGSLGAGKTAFAGGLADGLGIQEYVTSPSFVLMKTYTSGFIPMVHADVYRLGSFGEFDDLDVFEEARDGVLVVEWGDAVASTLPADYLKIIIDIAGETDRTLRFEPHGAWRDRPLEEISA
ncbi:MAG: tRNA (adenosine(37)-N6)-threonylcarbamoyltransferase complex ATPase subunit type 1 TsaE [Acidimicrobiia bacterium]|nr:tRNA (adenosine(37)-N6)-threonylcarbamoyltransferase complex ATPase subunit type 1 TsaE [Acidimicrobiia bacterium]